MMTTLTARPEAITFDPQQSALIVVDMQNAYATPRLLRSAGFDVSTTRPVIANIQTAVTAARAAGMLIIWFQNGWDEQYVEAGGPGSPNFHKSNALKTMRKQPQLQGKLLAKGSGIINWWMNWCRSRRYCAAEAALQRFLQYAAGQHFAQPWNTPSGFHRYRYQRLRRIDATRWLFLEYFGVVLEDATHRAGPEFAQKAALFNIETFFGWVSDVETFCDALSPTSFAHIA